MARIPLLWPLPPSGPSAPVVKAKKIKHDPDLNIPPGLLLSPIRSPENIPTKYIKNNFSLEDHRESKTKMIEGYPLLRTIIEQALGLQLFGYDNGQHSEYDDDDDENYERRHRVEGVPIKIDKLINTLKNILSSEATLALFQSAKIYCYPEEEHKRLANVGSVIPMEIILCKEEIIYETDEQVITKLKKRVFAEISRYRRAKALR